MAEDGQSSEGTSDDEIVVDEGSSNSEVSKPAKGAANRRDPLPETRILRPRKRTQPYRSLDERGA